MDFNIALDSGPRRTSPGRKGSTAVATLQDVHGLCQADWHLMLIDWSKLCPRIGQTGASSQLVDSIKGLQTWILPSRGIPINNGKQITVYTPAAKKDSRARRWLLWSNSLTELRGALLESKSAYLIADLLICLLSPAALLLVWNHIITSWVGIRLMKSKKRDCTSSHCHGHCCDIGGLKSNMGSTGTTCMFQGFQLGVEKRNWDRDDSGRLLRLDPLSRTVNDLLGKN